MEAREKIEEALEGEVVKKTIVRNLPCEARHLNMVRQSANLLKVQRIADKLSANTLEYACPEHLPVMSNCARCAKLMRKFPRAWGQRGKVAIGSLIVDDFVN